jgi:hypothetical protein
MHETCEPFMVALPASGLAVVRVERHEQRLDLPVQMVNLTTPIILRRGWVAIVMVRCDQFDALCSNMHET